MKSFLILFLTVNYYICQNPLYIRLEVENRIIGNGPELMGIGMGHSSLNGNWAKFLERLGVNAARLFVSPSINLRTFITNWGRDLNNNSVINYATFTTAVQSLRTPQGRDPKYSWPNPVKWQQIFDSLKKVNRPIYGSDENTINVLNSLKINPLIVEHIGCDSFQFYEMNKNSSIYWSERWELYKYSYALAIWARSKGVGIIEFYNEPDLELSGCLNASLFNEYYLVRSLSIQNAYEDYNKVDNFNVQIKIAASAFARKTFGGDLTRYLGSLVVENKNVIFGSFDNDSNWNNMHLYSYHSYDKTGRDLYDDLIYLQNSISSVGSSYPVILTEHNSHTSSNWDTIATTSDTASEASRLSSQIANIIRANNIAHYVFKFSITPSFSPNRDIAKNGIHWGEISTDPYDLSDSTLSAESFRLMTTLKQSQLLSVVTNDTSKFRSYFACRKGDDNYLLIVNDKSDLLSFNLNLTQLGVGNTTNVLIETIGEKSNGDILIKKIDQNGILNFTLPPFSTSKLTLKASEIKYLDSQASCSAFANGIGDCTSEYNFVGTSNSTQHDTTSISVIKFKISNLNRNSLFVLKMNIEQVIYENTFLILGFKNPINFDLNNFSWSSLSGILKPLSNGVQIDSITKNFINWNSTVDLSIVGHLAAKNGTNMIDITDYVRFMIDTGKSDLIFLLYRPFRHPSYKTSIGIIDSDDLSFGSNIKISSAFSNNKPQILILDDLKILAIKNDLQQVQKSVSQMIKFSHFNIISTINTLLFINLAMDF